MAKKPTGPGDDGKVVELRPGKGKRRLSSVDLLPDDLRAKLNEAIADGRMSVDDLWALVRDGGGDISRSAVGRYKVREERAMEDYRRAQQMASVWSQEREKDPNGAVAQLLNELSKKVAFQRLISMDSKQAENVDPKDLLFITGAIKSIAQTDKIGAEREALIRKQAIERQRREDEKALRSAVDKGDIDAAAAQRAREILGFA